MSKIRVLVVEDEAIAALDIRESLEASGFEVVESVDTGDKALDAATRTKPDLALMDIKLRGDKDGIETAGILWKSLNIPCVFLTAFADEETLQRAKLSHPFGYILKPFDSRELKVHIEMALAHASEELVSADTPPVYKRPVVSSPDALQALSAHSTCSKWSPSILEQLSSQASISSLSSSETLLLEQDEVEAGFIILSGSLFVVQTTIDGKEFILEVLSPSSLFGVISPLFCRRSPYTIRAHQDSVIVSIPRETIERAIAVENALCQTLLKHSWRLLVHSHTTSRGLAYERVEYRIASTLLDLVGSTDNIGNSVHLTRQQLAEIAGTTPETAIRITKMLERDGILGLKKPGVIVIQDREGLRALSGSSTAL